ncbi:hypothetical protein V6478_001266 [Providencia rettgeri]|uniref:hypothetical protein n=1 Tax=Providencia sp. PROV148 TaxID=2949858 RepID=UPI0023498C65|nr:hypothetical protein [Providencia sp. PROV148]EJD6473790.1 hypothetical protein [Providencia rettgeri]ELR5067997.1 hypothetical protein [Providencia rettgeri]ELR5162558.1 hypothetical protein [Providencia rettgeri]
MDIGDLLTFLGVIVTALATLRVAHISFRSKNVNEQRILWREHVRELTSIIVSSSKCDIKKEAIAKLTTRLNPVDERDKKIIEIGHTLISNKNQKNSDKFVELVSLMLKYDWERCKLESMFFPWCYEVVINTTKGNAKSSTLLSDEEESISGIRIELNKCKVAFLSLALFGIWYLIDFLLINHNDGFNISYNIMLITCQPVFVLP